jgi:NhaP-type Na+/H+ or K+/H+ antiporter
VGSFYYLAYATAEAGFEGVELVWATAGLIVVVSVLLHGVAATPIMKRLDRARGTEPAPGIDGSGETAKEPP